MPPYRLAQLNPDQMSVIESLENELGVTLVAYEPAAEERPSETAAADDGSVLDALVDDYRTYDPHLGYC